MTLKQLQIPLWVLDTETMRVIWANRAGIEFWGAPNKTELYARDLGEDLSEAARERLDHIIIDCYQHGRIVNEIWTLYPQGLPPRTGELSLSSFPVADTRRTILVQVNNDISGASADMLHSTTALNHTAAMISLYDGDYKLLYSNPAARNVLTERCHTLPDILINDTDLHLIQESLETNETCTVEVEVNTIKGPRWHNMIIRRTMDALSSQKAILISATDATERRYAQQVAYKLAYSDALTGLPNRTAMNIYLDELLSDDLKSTARFGLFFLDLDRFKIINDSLGHAVGDRLLVEVAHRLKISVGANGMVCRLGGDEFVTIINSMTDVEQLRTVAQTILQDMGPPLEMAGQSLRILPSIGICRYPEDGGTISELMEHADAAMYLAKAQQSGYCFFDEKKTNNLSETVKERMGLENDLVGALKQNEFELYYQPKISCKTMNVIGVEALIRWNHPTRGLVPPDSFIKIAEETGQIIEIGDWVMDTAMKQQRKWYEAGLMVPVAINISARQFEDDSLLSNVSDCLLRNRCDSSMIELEITESMLLGNGEQLQQTLHQISAMGIKIALDDFGTGYSNLAYLQNYPLDTLKVDRIFLANRKHTLLMATILSMGKVLGLNVVAEGVQDASQVDWLIANGCDQLQGYYFSKPLTAENITTYLTDKETQKTQQPGKAA